MTYQEKFPKKKVKNVLNPRAQPKVKLKSISKLKKDADKWCSLYVRKKEADENGMACCYTCDRRLEWKWLQAGHFISRGISASRYDTRRNIRVQCYGCNVWGRGQYHIYADKLLKELGTKEFKALLAVSRESYQFTRQELEEIIKTFKEKVANLNKL